MYILLIIILGYLIYYKFITILAKEQYTDAFTNYNDSEQIGNYAKYKVNGQKNSYIKMSTPKNMRKYSFISDEINTLPFYIANTLKYFSGDVRFDVITKTTEMLESTNIDYVNNGEFDFALCTEYSLLNTEKHNNTRVICSLNKSYLFLVVRDNSSINTIEDLIGKVVGINSSTSETFFILNQICEILGLSLKNFSTKDNSNTKTIYFKTDGINELFNDFYNNVLDGLFIVSSHNLPYLFSISERVSVRFIDLNNSQLELFSKQTSNQLFLKQESINIEPYNTFNNSRYLDTFYTKNVLICNKEIAVDEIYNITKNIFVNINLIKDNLREIGQTYFEETYDPFYNDFKRQYMIYSSNKLQLHKGANKYYEEINVFTSEDKLCEFYNEKCNVYPYQKVKFTKTPLISILDTIP